jgi:enterobactin synthetase component D / holo-[acyl-carrier protein] synthase
MLGAAPWSGWKAASRRPVTAASSDAWLIEFDWRTFDPGAFASARIECPESVARAIRKRQAAFFFGRAAARLALSGFGMGEVDVPMGEWREPLWPAGIAGSISHCASIAAALAVPCDMARHVGLDVETVIDDGVRPAVVRIVLDTAEMDCLVSLQDALPLNTLTTIAFSAKESLFKATFSTVRRRFGFSAARVSAIDLSRRRVLLRITEPLSAELAPGVVREAEFTMVRSDIVMTSVSW